MKNKKAWFRLKKKKKNLNLKPQGEYGINFQKLIFV